MASRELGPAPRHRAGRGGGVAPILAGILLLGAGPSAWGAGPAAGAGDGDIDAYIQSELAAQGIVGLALGVVTEDGLAYTAGYGFADRGRRIPVDPAVTRFRWASVSKTLTGVMAGVAWDRGAFDPDLPVEAYLPTYLLPGYVLVGDPGSGDALAPMPEGAVMTTGMLLGHTAGVQHYSNGLAKPTPPIWERNSPAINTGVAWALDRWVDAPLIKAPGEGYSYSTMGFNLAGVAIGAAWAEAQGGEMTPDEGFISLMEEGVIGPSGATGIAIDYHWDPLPGRARGYGALDPALTLPVTDTDVSWKAPGGGIASTIEGLGRYCHGLMGDAVLSPEAKALIWTRQTLSGGSTTGYGMGFDVGSRGGHPRVSHSGEQEGATSRLVLYTEDDLCIVILTNTQSSGDVHTINLSRVANGVEDILRARMDAGEAVIQGE